MDYAELTKALRDYLKCDEETFQQNVEQFVRAAERRIYLYARTPDSRTTTTGTLTGLAPTLQLPDDFQEPLQFMVTISGTPTNLLLKEPSFISEAYAGSTGTPRYYGVLSAGDDTTIVFTLGPTPDVDYDYELRYIRRPPSIVDMNTTWLGEQAHTALLYCSIVEGYTFLKGDADLMKLYSDRALVELDAVKRLTEGVMHMDVYRNPELRVAV